jgi:ATPase subunit of ABC transporter with duplicated ATPase domains
VEKQRTLGISIGNERSPHNVLFRLKPEKLDLGDGRELHLGELAMGAGDRVALVGANGTGKSTLIRHIMHHLALPRESFVYLAQEIDAAESRDVMRKVRLLSNEKLGEVLSIISRLGSQPESLRETEKASPGELRKILLALGMMRNPQLIIMDEPTNHMDLPSIECVEAALQECECALLLVSHDMRFLRILTETCWEISSDKQKDGIFPMTVRIKKWM